MDFFKMKFCTLFLEKHGKTIFDKICKMIEKENSEQYNEKYIEIIFKISFLNFCGVEEKSIKQMLNDNMDTTIPLNIKIIKELHKDSINEIQTYLKSSMEETINDFDI